jgi:outer membrane lipoprotein-sorting protein
VAALLLSLAIAPASSGTDAEWTLSKVMMLLAGVKHLESTFVEKKRSSFLTDELVLSGTLRFTAPDTLEKHVLSPFDEMITIDHHQITIERQEGDTVQQFVQTISPAVRTIIDSIRATLAGDQTRLQRHYEIEVSGNDQSWSLQLLPKDSELKKYLRVITIDGMTEKIVRIVTEEADGDRSVIEITYKNIVAS